MSLNQADGFAFRLAATLMAAIVIFQAGEVVSRLFQPFELRAGAPPKADPLASSQTKICLPALSQASLVMLCTAL